MKLALTVALFAVAFVTAEELPVMKQQGYLPFADEPIRYRSAAVRDPIARLQEKLDNGEARLPYDPRSGYLEPVLSALGIPVSSQALVFSKTSFQFPLISPSTPRALYFNDDVYVGQVQGAKFLEFISFDPIQGAIFYVLDAAQAEHPRFERAAVDCVQCHVGTATHGVPGVMLRSVLTRPSGYPVAGVKTYVTGQESPLVERWGGWYVTGHHGSARTIGNATVASTGVPDPESVAGPELASLGAKIRGPYLSDRSDVVALLVLAHQTQMHNLITALSYQVRIDAGPTKDSLSEKAKHTADDLVDYLTFTNEAPLDGPVVSSTSFSEDFSSRGPRDDKGRSLRDFDLQKKMFRYPCSYLIYSDDLNALPPVAKHYVYDRLMQNLADNQQPEARAAIEILVDTKPDLAGSWRRSITQRDGTHSQGETNDTGKR